MIAVSACLLWCCVRYDGKHQLYTPLKKLYEDGLVISICPEIFGGLPTPRAPAEIIGGNGDDVFAGRASVVDSDNVDVTQEFIRGAYIALEKIQLMNVRLVVLKSNSPSCGSQHIYSGQFDGNLKVGMGVCAALFKRHNIDILDETSPDLVMKINGYFETL